MSHSDCPQLHTPHHGGPPLIIISFCLVTASPWNEEPGPKIEVYDLYLAAFSDELIHHWWPIYSGNHPLQETLHAKKSLHFVFWNNELCFHNYYVHFHMPFVCFERPVGPGFISFYSNNPPGSLQKPLIDWFKPRYPQKMFY